MDAHHESLPAAVVTTNEGTKEVETKPGRTRLQLLLNSTQKSLYNGNPLRLSREYATVEGNLATIAGDKAKVSADSSLGHTMIILEGPEAESIFNQFKIQYGSVLVDSELPHK